MFCTKCGALIEENAMFCGQCGTPVPQYAPSGQNTNHNSMPPFRQSGPKPDNGGKKLAAILLIIAVLLAAGGTGICFGFFRTPRENAENEEAKSKENKSEKSGGKQTESAGSTEQSAPARLLQEYLENDLAAQYGYANLEKQTKSISYSDTNYDNGWTGTAGLAGSEILDLDGDGDDEMAAVILDAENILISIYEDEDGKAVKKAEASQKRSGDMSAYSEIISIVDGKEGKYLLFSQDYSGLVTDGYYSRSSLYQYDGESLRIPLEIVQDAGGSSDFLYNAYQYKSDASLLSKETVYNETYGNGQNYNGSYFISRVEALFGQYGIAPANDAFRACDSIYGALAAFNSGRQTLLNLAIWGEPQGDSVVYHFNDWDSPILAYQRFLNNEETLRIRGDALYTKESRASWTMSELAADINAQSKESFYDQNPQGIYKVEYAFLDCGNDGFEEMAIRFVGMNIYDRNDDSDLTAVITCKNGYLELVYSFETWARSYTEIDYYGAISSGGSAGAGDHLFGEDWLDAGGNVQDVYDGELLGGWWASYVSESAYNAAFGDAEPSFSITVYTISGSNYHTVDIDAADAARCERFVSLCKQEGKIFVTQNEIDTLIQQRRTQLGTAGPQNGKPLNWSGWYGEIL